MTEFETPPGPTCGSRSASSRRAGQRRASLTPAADRADHHAVKAFVLALTLVSSALAAGCTRSEQTAAPVETTTCSEVLYEGEGKPDAIIVSDLDLRGANQPTATAMVRVIKGVLRQRGFRAGEYRIGYQSCYSDDEGPCERNAKAYASTTHVLGVIGPFFSCVRWLADTDPQPHSDGATRDGEPDEYGSWPHAEDFLLRPRSRIPLRERGAELRACRGV